MPALFDDPVVSAMVQQQASQRDAFVARSPVPVGLAASPRDPKDEEEVAATTQQCVATGLTAPSRLPLAVIRPSVDWWWR